MTLPALPPHALRVRTLEILRLRPADSLQVLKSRVMDAAYWTHCPGCGTAGMEWNVPLSGGEVRVVCACGWGCVVTLDAAPPTP